MRWMLRFAYVTCAVVAVSGSADSFPLVVRVASGSVRGSGSGVVAFKGIPYAAPPTRNLRWSPPATPAPWTDVRDARTFGPQCPQPGNNLAAVRALPSSEDCLTLNVWTPATSNAERLPVMVWFHGGAYAVGSGAAQAGEALARHGVVVVTLNYRLGVLGFFAHPSLSRESVHGVSGNYGLLDQIAALRWVHDNIAAFGGNPANVTIFGQSAGSSSVAFMMVAPLARGLFHRAIAESLGVSFRGANRRLRADSYGMESAESHSAALATDIAELRALTPDQLFERLPAVTTLAIGVHRYPVIDGLSEAMAGAWVQFAKTGNPNGGRLPQWPAYHSPDYRVMTFGDEIGVGSNATSPVVDFFSRVFDTMRGK